jgi:hypothetical protein
MATHPQVAKIQLFSISQEKRIQKTEFWDVAKARHPERRTKKLNAETKPALTSLCA